MDSKEIKERLRAEGFRPRKSLGQNFLSDPRVIERIVQAAEIGPEDLVLEIGPGAGFLTLELARRAGEVIAVELDRRLIPLLEEVLAPYPGARVVAGDILKVDLPALLANRQAKVVANLPYYITTPVLFRLLEHRRLFPLMVLMVQKEVARRMTASPGSKEYGALTVNLSLYTKVEYLFTVPAGLFWPRPEVDSAVVRLRVFSEPFYPVGDEGLFARVVQALFGQRRKTAANALSHGLGIAREEAEKVLVEAGIDPGRRGETLSVEEFARLGQILAERK